MIRISSGERLRKVTIFIVLSSPTHHGVHHYDAIVAPGRSAFKPGPSARWDRIVGTQDDRCSRPSIIKVEGGSEELGRAEERPARPKALTNLREAALALAHRV